MNFTSKLLLGAAAAQLLAVSVTTWQVHDRLKLSLRNDFSVNAERLANSLAASLSAVATDTKLMCDAAAKIAAIRGDSFRFLKLNPRSGAGCNFGDSVSSELNLSAPDVTLSQLEASKVFTTYAAIECKGDHCPVEVEVGVDFAVLNLALANMRNSLIINAVWQMLGSALFLTVFAFLVRRRLAKLEAGCAELRQGNLKISLQVGGRDEITRVAEAMNAMAHNLNEAMLEKERQRQSGNYTSKMTALGEMAAGIAHEVNNPLMIIMGKAQTIQRKIMTPNFTKEEAIAELEKIKITVERIGKIVKGLRSFARSGDADPFQSVPIGQIIQETVDLCGERFRHHGIEVKVTQIPNQTIDCRAVQISQVLLNLLNNSFDAIQELPNKWIEIRTNIIAEAVHLRVIDSGLGIPPEVVSKLMQPFFTTKAVGKGTGLGLSVSKGIIEEHHGVFSYETFESHTSFLLVLPIQQVAAATQKAQQAG